LLTLRMGVSSGTYVRSLAHDLGQALGCGGHVVALRRTGVGGFNQVEAIALEELTPDALLAHLRLPAAIVAHLPRVEFDGEAVAELRFGRRVPADVNVPAGDVAAFDPAGDLVGIVAIEAGEWRARKVLAATEED
jgi:tRNA pseudouridine55 synthase